MLPETPAGTGQGSNAPMLPAPVNGSAVRESSADDASVVAPPILRTTGRAIASLAAALMLNSLVGCGSLGATDFSGGGVPIGGSRLFGHVVAADRTVTMLSGVDVAVHATPSGGTTRDFEATTGQDGAFSFSNVLPGFSNGTVQVVSTPPADGYRPQSVTFTVSNGHTEQMLVTLPPASFDPSTAKSLAITVASPAVPPGGSVQVQAVLRDAQGRPLPLTPTLVFDGNFGTLNADGTFNVPKGVLSGMGTISAFWPGLPTSSQEIHVDISASQQPPGPPVLPRTTG